MRYREFDPLSYYQVDGDRLDDFAYQQKPDSPPASPPQVISPPDDFEMLRRMQEFRESAPVARGLPALPAAQQTSAIDKMTQQILGQGTTSKWTGTGFGSVEANARGMAEQLAKYGLTDISQFGTKIVDVPEGKGVAYGPDGEYETITPAYQKRVYYNKATGQEIMPDYARAGDNIWSGTYAGQGSTGFGVDFDEEGNPYFYTQYGGSTSDWTNTVRPALQFLANTVGMVTPLAPYIAAANAANAAKKGDWKTAILSALPAAGQIAGSLGASAQTVGALQTASQTARVLNALDKGDLLGAALGGANLAGVSDIAGIDLKDVTKAVNIAKAIESGNPLAIMQAGINLAGGVKDGGKGGAEGFVDQGTGGDLGYYPGQEITDEDLLQYFQASTSPDGTIDYSGYGNLSQEQLANLFGGEVDWSGYGTLDKDQLQDFFDMMDNNITITGQKPEKPFLGYETPDQDLTPEEALRLWGVTGTTGTAGKPGTTGKPGTPSKPSTAKPSGPDLSSLLGMMQGQEQGPIPLVVPENRADIKLMEDIYGTSLFAPSTGNETERAEELARLLRS